VLAGLACIADRPDILSVEEVPVSLWLRSDPDERANGEDRDTVVRICTQGQDKNDTVNLRDRASASHPIHFELSVTDDEPPSLDLSVFGTPTGVSDEEIVQGWDVENFAYTKVDKVTEYGRFEQQLPRTTVKSGRKVCHVYLYVQVSRLSVELYAIFAHDGRAVKPLEKTLLGGALEDGKLTTKWRKYQNVDMGMVRLKQVARPESLSTNPREQSASRSHQAAANSSRGSLASEGQQPEVINSRNASVSGSQQTEAGQSDVSPSNSSAVQLDEVHVGRASRKRTSSLFKSNETKRRTMSSLAARKRKNVSDRVESDAHSTGDMEAESEMEM
jgi:hypothetical protein